eukprot:scaffold12650_cov54-Cyclotella_meneghiniana.AAC.1
MPAGGVFQTEPPGGCLRQALDSDRNRFTKCYVLFRLFNAVRGVVALRCFLSILQIQPPDSIWYGSFYNSQGGGIAPFQSQQHVPNGNFSLYLLQTRQGLIVTVEIQKDITATTSSSTATVNTSIAAATRITHGMTTKRTKRIHQHLSVVVSIVVRVPLRYPPKKKLPYPRIWLGMGRLPDPMPRIFPRETIIMRRRMMKCIDRVDWQRIQPIPHFLVPERCDTAVETLPPIPPHRTIPLEIIEMLRHHDDYCYCREYVPCPVPTRSITRHRIQCRNCVEPFA